MKTAKIVAKLRASTLKSPTEISNGIVNCRNKMFPKVMGPTNRKQGFLARRFRYEKEGKAGPLRHEGMRLPLIRGGISQLNDPSGVFLILKTPLL